MKVIASYLELTHIVSRLSSGDVASNELFYHASCYKQLCNNYQSKKNEDAKSISTQVNGQEDFIKAVAFNKILTYVREGISAGECGGSFKVQHLESLYQNLLKDKNIPYTNNSTRFCEQLTDALPGVERRRTGNRLYIVPKKILMNIFLMTS